MGKRLMKAIERAYLEGNVSIGTDFIRAPLLLLPRLFCVSGFCKSAKWLTVIACLRYTWMYLQAKFLIDSNDGTHLDPNYNAVLKRCIVEFGIPQGRLCDFWGFCGKVPLVLPHIASVWF